ncbi:hypothetical protein PINS_up006075 [Pythium insidiosum]|nr:hypothetical protein PINS_up006075 [Pythium insidiosum]
MDESPEMAFVTHFYTLEKVAESAFHAVQSKNRTWQFLPGSEERSKSSSGSSANASSGGANSLTNVERPSRRVDVLDLDRCLEIAMRYVQQKKGKQHQRGVEVVNTATAMALIDRDFMTLQAKVAQRYGSTFESVGGGAVPATDDEPHNELACLLFEQKWSDIIFGELEAMLTTSFLEQGVLLRKARIRYAKAFNQLQKLFEKQSMRLRDTLSTLEETRKELADASEHHAQDSVQMRVHYEDEMKRVTADFELRNEELERKLTEAREQMAKMGDTMKTLNTIFRQMREDTEKVKAVELRENYIKLEKRYDASREEVERLRPLVALSERLQQEKDAVEQENKALQERILSFDSVIAAKDEVIANLMEQQSELLAAQELRAARDEELQRRAAEEEAEDEEYGDDGGNDDNEGVNGEDGAYSASDHPNNRKTRSRQPGRRRRGSAVVCVRCKQELRQLAEQNGRDGDGTTHAGEGTMVSGGDTEISDEFSSPQSKRPAVDGKKKRIQCLYFRILLPNLRGRRPQREVEWTFSCMRSILFAKQIDDSMCRRSGGVFPLRIRMPEFVYAWFSPWRSLREELGGESIQHTIVESDEASATDTDDDEDARRRLEEKQQQEADEDRWCLYYGVKSLVQDGYLEAKLFLSLLDEKYGEDEQVFLLYCYRILDALIGGKLEWGPLRNEVAYGRFKESYDNLLNPRLQGEERQDEKTRPRIPKTIWISPYHASLATSVVLSKATEAERIALDKKLQEFVVTNLPVDERPSYYLTAANARSLMQPDSNISHNHKRQKKSKQRATEDESEEEMAQFVDAHLWVELMMLEYKEEQAHRRAAVRLMFQTSTSAARGHIRSQMPLSVSTAAMDMEQFRVMVRTLNNEIPSHVIAMLFRAAYTRGSGSVNFDSFMDAAEHAQFFSSCMRLESPAQCIARIAMDSHSAARAVLSTSSHAAFMVDKYFTIFNREVTSLTRALPLWTRSTADVMTYEIASSLTESEGTFSDGIRLMTTFHRLLETLFLTQLVRHEVTGSLLSSKAIYIFEKAMHALLNCVRAGDKTAYVSFLCTGRACNRLLTIVSRAASKS